MRAGRGGVRALPFVFGWGWSLSMGGGSRTWPFTPMGRLLGCWIAEEPYVDIGGLFVVCPREGSGGRFLEAGRGGGGLLPVVDCAFKLFPTPCWFNAAIRAARDVNCGSSTSVIADARDQCNCVSAAIVLWPRVKAYGVAGRGSRGTCKIVCVNSRDAGSRGQTRPY